MKVRTYPDSSVLISAWRGTEVVRMRAIALLGDPNREFVGSTFLRMETQLKAKYYRNADEVEFYEEIFRNTVKWADFTPRLIELACDECSNCGVNAGDSFHIAAAHLVRAKELITNEEPAKSIYRARRVKVVSL